MNYYYVCLFVLTSLPLLAQWRWGWRGAVIAAAGALIFVAAAYYYIVTYGVSEPTPADWNPEARAEREVLGAFAVAFIGLILPAAAVLAGAVLAAIWALVRLAIRPRKYDTPGTPGADAPAPPHTASGT